MSQVQGHRSSVSQKSFSVRSQYLSDTSELTDTDLIKQVTDLRNQIKMLTLENEIFENTIMRLEPALMHGIQQALDYAAKLHSSTSLTVGSFVKSKASGIGFGDMYTSPSRMVTSPSRISTRRIQSSANFGGTIIYGTGPRINVLERSELVSQEIEIVIINLEKVKKKAGKEHALLKAKLEEIGLRVADVDKAVANFQLEVIHDGWDKIAQRIPAEIWIRFMTEWVKIIDGQIGKLRLRTSTLNTQYSKLRGQIRIKTELSESLRPVDFDKLKIENGECQEIIEQKLNQLEQLKQMTGDANLYLTIHKKAMMEQNSYLNNVLKTIKKREVQTIAIDKEREVIKVQADSLEQKLNQVQKVRLAYEIPDIMDYVGVKSELTDLKHSVHQLENRLRIQQIALSSLTKKLNSMFKSRKVLDF